MPTYRAYLINGNNRVSSFRAMDAHTDAEALKAARQFVEARAMWKSGISTARSGGSSAGKINRKPARSSHAPVFTRRRTD